MFRKSTLALAAAITLGAASLLSASTGAQAAPHGMGGMHGGPGMHGGHGHGGPGFGGGSHFRPGVMRYPGHRWQAHWYPRRYWGGYVRPVTYAPVAAAPIYRGCNCLTKEYTQDGQIVFRDLCTQETASSLVPGATPPAAQQSSEAAQPNNFAGRTYQDFLAANGPQQQQQPAQQN